MNVKLFYDFNIDSLEDRLNRFLDRLQEENYDDDVKKIDVNMVTAYDPGYGESIPRFMGLIVYKGRMVEDRYDEL